MKVELIKPIGHCFGVIKAIELAKQVRKDFPEKKVYVFGFLVHNEDVTNELKEEGIETIDITNINPLERLEEFSENDIVIFTAHGHPKSYEDVLNKRGVKYLDASCPKVLKSFEMIQRAKETIYIGKDKHPETVAALTKSDNVHLYDIKGGFDYSKVTSDNPIVLNQTTLSFLELKEIHEDIKRHLPNSRIENEICDATLLRQKAIINLKDDIDLIVIVGSKMSSNTNKLFEVAKKDHPSKKVIFVENIRDLGAFSSNYRHAAIVGGTSTPLSTINKIKEYLERL